MEAEGKEVNDAAALRSQVCCHVNITIRPTANPLNQQVSNQWMGH